MNEKLARNLTLWLTLVLLIVVLVAIGACGPSEAPEPTEAPEEVPTEAPEPTEVVETEVVTESEVVTETETPRPGPTKPVRTCESGAKVRFRIESGEDAPMEWPPMELGDEFVTQSGLVFVKDEVIVMGPELVVMEVVSDDVASRTRDYEDKRRDYAEAGIPEYWIIDPAKQQILVLGLAGDKYTVCGEFAVGDEAESKVLVGFLVNVARVLHAGES